MPKLKKKPKIIKPSKSLTLPDGYQRFDYYKQGMNPDGVVLDDVEAFYGKLSNGHYGDLYLYTHHEVFLDEGLIKHTRSSPNWEGGVVTYATCKHLMRSYNRDGKDTDKGWLGAWLVGLCPSKMDNCVMFGGKIVKQFKSNYDLSRHVLDWYPKAYEAKQANNNPRGDLYTPKHELTRTSEKHEHSNFEEPEAHTRSLEYYKKSPGSLSDRSDGKIPKWWRDHEYRNNQGRSPVSFILDPCYIFSSPQLWTSYKPGRASMKLNPTIFAESLEEGAEE